MPSSFVCMRSVYRVILNLRSGQAPPRGRVGWAGAVEDGEGSAGKDRDSSHGNLFHAEARRRGEEVAEIFSISLLRDLSSATPRENEPLVILSSRRRECGWSGGSGKGRRRICWEGS